MAINGLMGFAILLAALFCMGDPETALFSETGYPFIDIFVYGTGSIAGGTALVSTVGSLSRLSYTPHSMLLFAHSFRLGDLYADPYVDADCNRTLR